MNESPQFQALLALLGVGVFSRVWLGLAVRGRKISPQQHSAPSFNVDLNAAYPGRLTRLAALEAVPLHGNF